MADEPKPPPASIWEPVLLVGGIIAALFAVAAYRGNLKNLNGQGFLQSPLPPVGDGSTYTPQNIPGLPGMPTISHPSTTTASSTYHPNK